MSISTAARRAEIGDLIHHRYSPCGPRAPDGVNRHDDPLQSERSTPNWSNAPTALRLRAPYLVERPTAGRKPGAPYVVERPAAGQVRPT